MNKRSKISKPDKIAKLKLRIGSLGNEIRIIEARIHTLKARESELIQRKFLAQQELEDLRYQE